MNEDQVDAYLARIGLPRPERADLDALRRLQRAHLGTVPFENLSIHLGEPIELDEPSLLDKIVERWRGGFCYELNGAFAALLTALGYRVELHSARPFTGDRVGPPFDHLALRVELDSPWLVDVGFGRFAHHPLRLDTAADQVDPGGVFRVEPSRHGDVDVLGDGPEYRLEPRPYLLSDFVPTCWWQQTSPRSHFTQSLTCSRLTDTGRVTLSADKLIETVDGARTEVTLADDEILPAYQRYFGIALDQVPKVGGASVRTASSGTE